MQPLILLSLNSILSPFDNPTVLEMHMLQPQIQEVANIYPVNYFLTGIGQLQQR